MDTFLRTAWFSLKKKLALTTIKSGTVYVATNPGTPGSKSCREFCTNTQKENKRRNSTALNELEGHKVCGD